MSGTLYVVSTPIGNLEDITLRALRVLREVAVVAAEDTRHTAKLLNHHGIAASMVSFHEHNTQMRVPRLIARLQAGEDVALVSDAGTPGVSDPGLELVQACVTAGISVDPIPGATAPLAAVLASGFPIIPLTIMGFAPNRATDRMRWLTALDAIPHTVTFFDSPHRIEATLSQAAHLLGERPICIGRELTKKHQSFARGTAETLLRTVSPARGEFTVVIGPKLVADAPPVVSDDQLVLEFQQLTAGAGCSRRAAVAAVARKFGLSTRTAYAAIERAKHPDGSGSDDPSDRNGNRPD